MSFKVTSERVMSVEEIIYIHEGGECGRIAHNINFYKGIISEKDGSKPWNEDVKVHYGRKIDRLRNKSKALGCKFTEKN
jgi:predicted metal-dependent peptidase